MTNVVAFNDATKDILFAECKWKDSIDAEKVLRSLKTKAGYVEWNRGKRKEYFAVFARSFSKRAKEAMCFDLKDVEKLV